MLDVDHIVAHLQIAKSERNADTFDFDRCGRAATRSDSSNRSRAQKSPDALPANKTVGKVSLQQRRSQHIAGKVRSLVSIAFPAARAAAQAIGSVVLGEHIGEALNFSRIRHGQNTCVPPPTIFCTSSIIAGTAP